MLFSKELYILSLSLSLLYTQVNSEPEIDFLKCVQPYDEFYNKCAHTCVTCDESAIYRTINGSCNNLKHPLWGSTGTPYIRLGPATFCDNEYEIRLQSDGRKLPDVRVLQLDIFLPKSCDTDDCRNFHMGIFGQWVTHDITLMVDNVLGPPDCCAIQDSENLPPQCGYVINVPCDDPKYSPLGIACIEFRRTMTSTLNYNCPISPQIAMNIATVFVDASHMYGHRDDIADELRSHECGKIRTGNINGKTFMCQKKRHGSSSCDGRLNVSVCFDGGDPRSNMHFGVIIYQEVFVRLHNYLTDKLKVINTAWTDEILYQEARKIIGAINQIATYRHYLPILLGEDYSEKIGLTLQYDKKTEYDPSIMPQAALEFVAATFRVPHNQIPSVYYFVDQSMKIKNQMNLNEYMGDSDPIVEGSNLEELLRGMSFMPGRLPVSSYNALISNFMFHNWYPVTADQDLLSIDIQRGRDVAVVTYVQARERCGFSKILSFEDLKCVFEDEDIALLKKFYADVVDIDLIVGSLLEKPAKGAMVGETARCIIADGFYRIRYGDRLFCDVQGQPGSFTQDQFDVLWDLDLTKIFCAMTDIDELPCDFFKSKGFTEIVTCKRPLDLDLQAWKTKDCEEN